MTLPALTLPQGPELIIILAVLVLLFGARKLPELGSSIGKTITNFRKGMDEAKDEVSEEEASGEEAEGKQSEGSSAKDRDEA